MLNIRKILSETQKIWKKIKLEKYNRIIWKLLAENEKKKKMKIYEIKNNNCSNIKRKKNISWKTNKYKRI